MRFDIEDVLSHAFGRSVACVLFFTSAIWIGSMIGGLACLIDHERSLNILTADLFQLLLSPRLLISLWITPNVIFLAIMLMRMFVKEEGMNHMTWGIVMSMESLFVMLGTAWIFPVAREILSSPGPAGSCSSAWPGPASGCTAR